MRQAGPFFRGRQARGLVVGLAMLCCACGQGRQASLPTTFGQAEAQRVSALLQRVEDLVISADAAVTVGDLPRTAVELDKAIVAVNDEVGRGDLPAAQLAALVGLRDQMDLVRYTLRHIPAENRAVADVMTGRLEAIVTGLQRTTRLH